MTPYIESGNVEEGQEMALVLGLLDGLSYEEQPESYSGFLTVDKNYDSNMFFWFIPATVSNGILLPKLFWPTVRKNCCSDREKLLKFEAESREFSNFWDH